MSLQSTIVVECWHPRLRCWIGWHKWRTGEWRYGSGGDWVLFDPKTMKAKIRTRCIFCGAAPKGGEDQ